MMEKNWQGDTFGNNRMHRWLIGMLRHSDVRIYYAFAAVFVVPVCMFVSRGARYAYGYFRELWHERKLKALWHTYLNLVKFSQVVIDRFAMFAGKRMKLKVEHPEAFERLAEGSEGFVMLSAHIGCHEMAGYELVSDHKRFNALVYSGEKASVMQGRQQLFGHNNIRMIPIRQDMSHLFAINTALANGEIVSIPGDRVFGSPRTVTVTLLGREAHLPQGPFSVATMRGLNVIAVNVMKTSLTGYTVYVTSLAYDKQAPRNKQIQQLADAYAAELERMLRRYPTQWYNFFDFWNINK